ncbi:MAG: enoyl-CoA hydratase-related protein [Myxococcales bacterium]|nr:enoyl-CoA hydratase-related protein [Myxococcales bacterium]
MAYGHIAYEVSDPVATITLDRPDKLNAWTGQMEAELKDALGAAERDPAVVGIIITGRGRAFCAGADMELLQSLSAGEGVEMARGDAQAGDDSFDRGYRGTYSYLASIRKPILAAINGPCVGMAVPISCFMDMRFMSEDAYFMTAFARRGLIAEWGSSWMLPRLVGTANAFDLLLSSRKVGADEALRMGLANRVLPAERLLEEARAYIQTLADHCAPGALAQMKKQVYQDLMTPLDGALDEANRLMLGTIQSDDFKEGVSAFLDKRRPKFKRLG